MSNYDWSVFWQPLVLPHHRNLTGPAKASEVEEGRELATCREDGDEFGMRKTLCQPGRSLSNHILENLRKICLKKHKTQEHECDHWSSPIKDESTSD